MLARRTGRGLLVAWLLLCSVGVSAQSVSDPTGLSPEQLEAELDDAVGPDDAPLPSVEGLPPEPQSAEPLAFAPPPDALSGAELELSEDEINVEATTQNQGGVGVGPMMGWGFAFDPANPWQFGLGVSGGFTTDSGVHAGARFLYFLGSGEQNIFDFGVEAGFAVSAGPVRFIPTLGGGLALYTEGTRSEPIFYLAPGGWLRLELDGYYVGVDSRMQFIFAGPTRQGFVLMLGGGLSY